MNINSDEWQIEKTRFGTIRRFRMLGNIKEYEPTVVIDGLEIPQSEVEAYNEQKRVSAAKQLEEEQARATKECSRICPFSDGIDSKCSNDLCALYTKGCALTSITKKQSVRDTFGLKCPFNPYKCRKECVLYNKGCVLSAIGNRTKENNKNE